MRVATISAIHTAQVCLSQDAASVPFTKLGTSLVLQRLLLSSSETACSPRGRWDQEERAWCLPSYKGPAATREGFPEDRAGVLRVAQPVSEWSRGNPGGEGIWTTQRASGPLTQPPLTPSSPAGSEECSALLPTHCPEAVGPGVCPGATTVWTHLHVPVLPQH